MYTTHWLRETMISGSAQERLSVSQEVVTNLDEWLPILAARKLTRLTFKAKEGDWLATITATRKGRPQVAFTTGDNLQDLQINLAHGVIFGLLAWKTDKYSTMRSDKPKRPR